MVRPRFLLGIVAFLPVAAACFPSLDGFTNGSPTLDGGSPDAVANDADVTLEAGTDASTDEKAPCPASDPNIFICEDFESAAPPDFGWGEPVTNGVLTVEPSIGRRGSRALHARQDGRDVTSYDTSSGMRRLLDAKLPMGRTITVSFWFMILSTTNLEAVTIVQVENGSAWTIELSLFKSLECPGGDSCFSFGNYYQDGDVPYAKAARLRVGQWQQAEITVSTTATERRGSLRVDGNLVRESVLETGTPDQTAYLTIGALYGKRTTDLVLDDIVARRTP